MPKMLDEDCGNRSEKEDGSSVGEMVDEIVKILRKGPDEKDFVHFRLKGSNASFLPVQFCIPLERIVMDIPKKTIDFAPLLPGAYHTYSYTQPSEYFRMYRRSRFAITHKKGGWDTMRHYEILSQGAVPVFLRIEEAPEASMVGLPKVALAALLRLPGLRIASHDPSLWWKNQKRRFVDELFSLENDALRTGPYDRLAGAFLNYTKNFLTCSWMASKVLKVTKTSTAKRVLFISEAPFPDYLRDGLLIGLRRNLERNLVEQFCVPHLRNGEIKTMIGVGKGRFHPSKKMMAQSSVGTFSMTGILKRRPCITYPPAKMAEMISNNYFDLVIYGSITRSDAHLDLVKKKYPRERVIFIVGEDCKPEGFERELVERYSPFGHVMMREVCSGSAKRVR